MAEEIASLIAAHKMYLAANRVLRNDIVRAANSIGYPSDDAFMAHMNDSKRNDRYIYLEMQNMTESFDVLTTRAEQLAQVFRSNKVAAGGVVVQPLEIAQIREGVKQEVDCVLEAVMAEIDEVAAGELEASETEAAAARDAAELMNTAGSSIAGLSSTGNVYKRTRSQKN